MADFRLAIDKYFFPVTRKKLCPILCSVITLRVSPVSIHDIRSPITPSATPTFSRRCAGSSVPITTEAIPGAA